MRNLSKIKQKKMCTTKNLKGGHCVNLGNPHVIFFSENFCL